MIGTSFEMLLYLSYSHSTFGRLSVTHQYMGRIRNRIVAKSIDEEEVIAMLTKLDCVQIRERYVVPAIIRDKKGIIYTESSYSRVYLKPKIRERLQLTENEAALIMRDGHFKSDRKLKKFLNITGATLIEKRLILPSVWSYDPNVTFGDRGIRMAKKVLDI